MKKKQGLMGKKLGMIQIFNNEGVALPATLIYIKPNLIIDKQQIRNNYLLRLCYTEYKKRNIYQINTQETKLKKGDKIGISVFNLNEYVDVVSKSIGKGYAGVVKKYKFRGLEASHGVSKKHRSLGSTGQCQDPGKVFKGKKMSGQMGNKRTTIQNLKIIDINKELNILAIKGGIPGSKNSLVFIQKAVKKTYNIQI